MEISCGQAVFVLKALGVESLNSRAAERSQRLLRHGTEECAAETDSEGLQRSKMVTRPGTCSATFV
jgi:hypothetical protein